MDNDTLSSSSFSQQTNDSSGDNKQSNQKSIEPLPQNQKTTEATPAVPTSSPGPPPINLEKTFSTTTEKPSHIPLQKDDQGHLGVGTPNIGVEQEELSRSAPSPIAEEIKNPTSASDGLKDHTDKAENNVEIADYEAYPTTETPTKVSAFKKDRQTPDRDMSHINIKNYQDPPLVNNPQPPIPATNVGGKLIAIIILSLLAGAAGGFFGFKYWDQAKSKASVSNTPTASQANEEPSTDISKWKMYNSTLYNFSLKYPNGWYTSDIADNAESLVFASNEGSLLNDPTGYKIAINFQNSNGQTLKKWVEANTASIGETTKAKEITVSGQTAYQQELSKNGNKIATYIERPDKIMVVTYSAPNDLFGLGGDWYNNLINSIILM